MPQLNQSPLVHMRSVNHSNKEPAPGLLTESGLGEVQTNLKSPLPHDPSSSLPLTAIDLTCLTPLVPLVPLVHLSCLSHRHGTLE